MPRSSSAVESKKLICNTNGGKAEEGESIGCRIVKLQQAAKIRKVS